MSDYFQEAHRAQNAAWKAWREDGGRWSPKIQCTDRAHVWADGGGCYALVVDASGVPRVVAADELVGLAPTPVTLTRKELHAIIREYSLCDHVAGAPAADVGFADNVGYVYVVHGEAFITTI